MQTPNERRKIAALLAIFTQLLADKSSTGDGLHLRDVAFREPHTRTLGNLVLTNQERACCSLQRDDGILAFQQKSITTY